MQEREFYEIVQQRGRTDTVERAQVASEAVLETLGETLSAGEADDVATQLPSALGQELAGASHDPSGYDREAFVDRVGDRLLGTDLD